MPITSYGRKIKVDSCAALFLLYKNTGNCAMRRNSLQSRRPDGMNETTDGRKEMVGWTLAICRSGRIGAALVLLLMFSAGVAAAAGPAGNTGKKGVAKPASSKVIVQGDVERVSGDSIYIKGKEYRISGVPIEDPSGKAVKLGDVAPGNVAELFYYNRKLHHVLTYKDPLGGRR
jgi:hypothetical protein